MGQIREGVVVVLHNNARRRHAVSCAMAVRRQNDLKSAAESRPACRVDTEFSLQPANDQTFDRKPIEFSVQSRLIESVGRSLLDDELTRPRRYVRMNVPAGRTLH